MSKPSRIAVNFEFVAREVMFGGQLDRAKYGLVYRKGKSLEHVKKALQKARDVKNGHAKTETELSMLELYLRDVFLPTRGEVVQAEPGCTAATPTAAASA